MIINHLRQSNPGHRGRPGQRGGSAPGKGLSTTSKKTTSKTQTEKEDGVNSNEVKYPEKIAWDDKGILKKKFGITPDDKLIMDMSKTDKGREHWDLLQRAGYDETAEFAVRGYVVFPSGKSNTLPTPAIVLYASYNGEGELGDFSPHYNETLNKVGIKDAVPIYLSWDDGLSAKLWHPPTNESIRMFGLKSKKLLGAGK